MKMEGILPFARLLLEKAVMKGSAAIDATVGNGHDTVFLARLVGEEGRVFGFDIQEKALINTTSRLKEQGLNEQVTLFDRGHEQAASCIPPEWKSRLTGAVFNLGYLPKGDKSIVTKPETTITAVKQIFEMLVPGGIIVLVIYHGHEEGREEKEKLIDFVEKIDQQKAHVLRYEFINQANNPPFILAIEKR
ncbi:class I SAM-dependent methyltransferase [Bacillus badius]|uniref:SAM-dependent methyltransferase, MraW methylase family n=1 Tax=Bacillus badius TaxID=1455 RepID=A0ABR5ASX7_BACBA|nr:class I SAM-dependent methyltransferase [Bacillus badius]KIL77845.1 SAM-dependent methyltransferase, MraW methylase family [Bacillus badius]KZR59185.1 rRNA methyltransferase [Bacillus badius]MED4715653.1 class I SAM-dependent methyltransferase [Bacillus badius]